MQDLVSLKGRLRLPAIAAPMFLVSGPELVLAASGATPSAWRLCDGDDCRDIGADPGAAITLSPCPAN